MGEEVAAGLNNEILGGLLNATFGNAVEMILTIQTLNMGLFVVVKATLLGSVLSNLLLVLGMSLFLGGLTPKGGNWKNKVQTFNIEAATANVSMLLLATASIAFPTVFCHAPNVVDYQPETEYELTL